MRIMQMHVTQFSQKWGLALYCTDPLNYKKKYIYIFLQNASAIPILSWFYFFAQYWRAQRLKHATTKQ